MPAPIPSLAPALAVRDGAAAMDWYARVFGGHELFRLTGPDGAVVHGELQLGGGTLMIGEEAPEHGSLAPPSVGGTPVRVHLYVDDVDEVFRRAEARGAEVLIAPADQFYGDRSGRLRDPFGHEWILATRREELTPDEMQRRMEELQEG